MATKDEIASLIDGLRSDIERLVRTASTDGWTEGAYENGWNARQLLAHLAQVRAADDALPSKHFRAPWGIEGTVGGVIVASLNGHLRMHLGDLEVVLSKA